MSSTQSPFIPTGQTGNPVTDMICEHPEAAAMLIAALVVIVLVLVYMLYSAKTPAKSTFTHGHGIGSHVSFLGEHGHTGAPDRGDDLLKKHLNRKSHFAGGKAASPYSNKCGGAWDAEAIAEASALGPQGLGGLASDTSYGGMFDGWDTGSADTGDDGMVTRNADGSFNDAVASDV